MTPIFVNKKFKVVIKLKKKKKLGKGKMWIYKTLLKYLKNYVNLSWR